MASIRSLLVIAATAVTLCISFQARAITYNYSYTFTDGTVVDGTVWGEIDPVNTDRILNLHDITAGYTLPGGNRTEFNGSGSFILTYPIGPDRAYMSFSGKWNEFSFRDGLPDYSGTTNQFTIYAGFMTTSFTRYTLGEEPEVVLGVYDSHALDPATGNVLGWHLAPVPEPHAAAMYIAGLLGLVACLRIRSRKVSSNDFAQA